MEAPLIEGWLGGAGGGGAIPILDEASVSAARQRTREVAREQSLSAVDTERLATIASELAHNQLAHGRDGQLAVNAIVRDGHTGVEIVAADAGAGIADPSRALEGMPRGKGSLGIGLAAVREHAHELDVDVRLGEGTCVRARVFARLATRRREVGIFGRPYRDERRSGDHASFLRDGARLLVTVCDGLGHGREAREAADAAINVFAQHGTGSPRSVLERAHAALAATRGAVMAVVAVQEGPAPSLDLASVGNITVALVRSRSERRFGATSFVVGAAQPAWRPHVEVVAMDPHDLLVLHTDGIQSRIFVAADEALLRQHPVSIAHQLAERFGREDDDVLVLVAI